MMTIVFFLEEPSAREAIAGILPRICSMENVMCRYITFEGKQDLDKKLPKKLKGWRTPNTIFIVLRDQDSSNCKRLKDKLAKICHDAVGHKLTLVRIACHELESWYLRDLAAVEIALGIKGLGKKQAAKKYRNPDILSNPSNELKRLTNNIYQKVSGSRAIGNKMNIEKNHSSSFRVFVSGVRSMIAKNQVE